MTGIVERISETTKWHKYPQKDLRFPADSVVDAYNRGKEKGNKEHFEKILKQLTTELHLLENDIEQLKEEMNRLGFTISKQWLRIVTFGEYDVLFNVPDEDLLDNKFKEVYYIAAEIADSRKFHVDYTFVGGDKEDIDEDEIAFDGYIFFSEDGDK